MTAGKEVDPSWEDKPESINNYPVTVKDTEMGEPKSAEDEEEVGETEAESRADQEEDKDKESDEPEDKDDDDGQVNKLQHSLVDVSNDGRKESDMESSDEITDSPVEEVENRRELHMCHVLSDMGDDGEYNQVGPDGPLASLKSGLVSTQKSPVDDEKASIRPDTEENIGVEVNISDSLDHQSVDDEAISRTHVGASPSPHSSPSKVEHMTEEGLKDGTKTEDDPAVEEKKSRHLSMFDTNTSGGGDSGTEEEQAAFIMELHKFYKERGVDFRPPKFYGEPLNLLKLWRAVLKLGGYDKVTEGKYWRPVGDSFKPPKTCTTISWTFRIFYEKALFYYERFRTSDGGGLPVPISAENQEPGSGRARRDSAACAMQGWQSQCKPDNGEVSDPIIKDKKSVPVSKKEKPLKSLGGILKHKRQPLTDDAVKSVQMKLPRIHLDATVIDIGSPAEWVKINVRATRDCFEVYALVPGLLREEVRVQSDPAGRLVISGEPEDPDNPWNVTPFKKVVSLPTRIDPHQTSAVVTLHGQLFVRVPFEHYD